MLHCTMVVPLVNPVIVVFGLFADAIVPLPDNTLHVPTPTNGVLPAKVVLPVLTQIVCDVPALAMVGTLST